ncbi:MAG: DUF1289 domain-containing protein [Pseudomonadota bacterium]
MTVTSPCTGICKLDSATGWCLGCGRSGDEIADWNAAPEAWRDGVWQHIPDRLSQLGVRCRRLPWTTDALRDFVVDTLEHGRGTWVIGVVGAVAEFSAAPGAAVDVSRDGDALTARTRNGALRMVLNDDVRALTFDAPGLQDAPRIVLAVKRECRRLPVAKAVHDLGEDAHAVIQESATRLFDLGVGRDASRFCVRVAASAALGALEAVDGLAFSDALPRIGATLVAESPTRVVESTLGRIEVQGQIPPPDARSPLGPHTHLLPADLASGRAMPTGMDLPRAYLPGAIYYPPR